MSAFLGPIHYWLYHKILTGEQLQLDVIKHFKSKVKDIEVLEQQAYQKYGKPDFTPLEQIINEGNIHGWLHERIGQMEGRLAYIVGELITTYAISIHQIAEIYKADGSCKAKQSKGKLSTPSQVYQFIFDHLVEGMPCDHVNEVLIDIPEKIVWQTTACVHSQYWKAEGVDVQNYYLLKEAWIQGVIEGLDEVFKYEKNNQRYTIRK